MELESAREAMEAGLSGQSAAPETQQSDSSAKVDASTQDIKDISDVIELDKLERFKYKGRELTPKEIEAWEKGHMMQSDYTKKTQALSEERKYYDNLATDLAAVRNNPSLKSEFLKIYPEKFHSYLDFLGVGNNQQQAAQQSEGRQSLDPEIANRLSKVDQLESYIKEQEVKAIDAKLDVIFQNMSKKYPMADEERVLAMAQGLHNQGVKLDDDMWEKIWSNVHGKTEEMFKSYQKNLVKQQQEASLKARDASGSGGGIPGAPPKRMTIKEATEAAIRDFSSRR